MQLLDIAAIGRDVYIRDDNSAVRTMYSKSVPTGQTKRTKEMLGPRRRDRHKQRAAPTLQRELPGFVVIFSSSLALHLFHRER